MIGSRAGWKSAAAAVLLVPFFAASPAMARRPQPRPHWSRIGPVAAWVNALAVTYGPGRVLAATADAGVFRSDDGGSSWVASGAGLPAAEVLDLAADPADAATADAATRAGLFRSRDGGATWSATGLHGRVDRVAVAPSADRRLYAVAASPSGQARAWRSDDGGSTWHAIDAGLHGGFNVQGLAVDAANPDRAYLALDGELLFTTRDGGRQWIEETAGLPGRILHVFAADPRHAGTLYLGASDDFGVEQDVYKSADGGATWARLTLPPHSTVIELLAVAPASGAVYAGFGSPNPLLHESYSLFRSADGGATWSAESVHEPLRQLVADPRRPGRAYAGSITRVLRREASGLWAVAAGGLRAAEVTAVRADPHAPNTLYVSARIGATESQAIDLGVLRSRDRGATWALADEGLAFLSQAKLVTSPSLPAGTLFALKSGGIYETTDSGANWAPLAFLGIGVTGVAEEPHRPQTLFASGLLYSSCGAPLCDVTAQPRAAESDDGGVTWTDITGRLSPPPASGTFDVVRIDPAHPWLIYLGGTQSYRSRDGGATWTLMPVAGEVFDLALDPAFPRTLYASEPKAGKVLKSGDAGATWALASAGLPTAATFGTGELATDPATSAIYLATDAGVLVSRDRAASWQLLTGLPEPAIRSVDADPFHPGTVYAGTAGGLFAYTP